MRCKSESAALGIIGIAILATALHAQEAGPGSPWRGAGAKPCFGPDGGTFQCRAAPGVIALRAGRLFDSKSGQMLDQPGGAARGRAHHGGRRRRRRSRSRRTRRSIDLSQATVLPGLIDAHTHMFNTAEPGMTRETLDAHRHPEPAGRSARRLHRGARHELARQRLRRRRHPQRHQRGPHRRSAISGVGPGHRLGAAPRRQRPANPLASLRRPLGRGSARGRARAGRARRRLDQAVSRRRLLLHSRPARRNTS